MINEVGLYPIRVEEVVEDDCLPNVETLAKQIQSWLPHLKHLPIEYRKEFLEDIIVAYLTNIPLKQDGSIH